MTKHLTGVPPVSSTYAVVYRIITTTRNANVVCPRRESDIYIELRGETHFSVLGSKARAGELTGGTPVRCFVIIPSSTPRTPTPYMLATPKGSSKFEAGADSPRPPALH